MMQGDDEFPEQDADANDDAPPSRQAAADWFGVFLFVGALLPRLWVALTWTGEAVWDGKYYAFGAQRIADGLGYSDDVMIGGHPVWHPWCHYPVGYSAVLALFIRIFGRGAHVAPALGACIGALLAVVTYALARHALPGWRARIAGLLVAAHPGLILYSSLVMTEPLAALLTLVAFWLAVRDRTHPRGAIFGAFVLGLAALVRPQALLCAPLLALGIPRAPYGKPLVHGIAATIIVCLVALIPVMPWTARNCRVMDGCALVSTNAGWNLAIGALPRATGRFEQLRAGDGCPDVTGQVQQDRCWFAAGVRMVAADPKRWLSLVPAKLGYTFDHESFAIEYLHQARPEDWPDDRRTNARGVLSTAHRLLVCLAALACVAWPGKKREDLAAAGVPRLRLGTIVQGAILVTILGLAAYGFLTATPTFWPLVVFTAIVPWLPLPGRPVFSPALRLPLVLLGTTVLTHAIFFGEDRYHIVVVPVFCLFAAAALRPSFR
jgi:hypothetical protein